MEQDTIDTIIALAITAYNKKSKPGEFARIAAHRAALDAARQYNSDLADFAALNAAAVFYTEITEALKFSAQITDKAISKLEASNNYQELWEIYSTTKIPEQITDNYFNSLAKAPDKISQAFMNAIAPTYDNTSVLDVVARNKAKRAALYVYFDTYAVTRAAYIRALFIASNNNPQHMEQKFSSEIKKRLKNDLTYDIIDPGLFLKVLSSFTLQALMIAILFTSIAGVLIAVFHLTAIPFLPLIYASSASIAVSVSITAGSFFAKNKCKQIENANNNRVENATII